jgi:hypothetical protein
MAAIWALGGYGDSPWSAYVVVGVVVAVLGLVVFLLAGGLGHLSDGLGYGAFAISLFLVGLGIASVVGGLAWRHWQVSHGIDPDF